MKALYIQPDLEILSLTDDDVIVTSFRDQFYRDPDELIADMDSDKYSSPNNG